MGSQTGQVERYFSAVERALSGLDSFLGDRNSPLYKHKLIGQIIVPYVKRLERTFGCWQNRTLYLSLFWITEFLPIRILPLSI